MFVRVKNVGPYQYLQIAQNRREGKRVKLVFDSISGNTEARIQQNQDLRW